MSPTLRFGLGAERPGVMRTCIAIAATAALVGCVRKPIPALNSTAHNAANGYGVIAALRPSQPTMATGTVRRFSGDDARNSILIALGTAPSGLATPIDVGGQSEFIIRADHDHTVSVVQANPENLRTGERVLLIRGSRTRIARAGAVAAE
jgi:hypothetical protein